MTTPNRSPLDYRSGGDDAPRRETTIPARVAAGVCSVLFVLLMVKLWLVDMESIRLRALGLDYLPTLLLCMIASVLCAMIALGKPSARKKKRP
jgi:hypothetical protein